MESRRVDADFPNIDGERRPRLNCAGTARAPERPGTPFKQRSVITFCTDGAAADGRPGDLLVEGVAARGATTPARAARVDGSAVRHASDLPGFPVPPAAATRGGEPAMERHRRPDKRPGRLGDGR
jgi:hypothetical protein